MQTLQFPVHSCRCARVSICVRRHKEPTKRNYRRRCRRPNSFVSFTISQCNPWTNKNYMQNNHSQSEKTDEESWKRGTNKLSALSSTRWAQQKKKTFSKRRRWRRRRRRWKKCPNWIEVVFSINYYFARRRRRVHQRMEEMRCSGKNCFQKPKKNETNQTERKKQIRQQKMLHFLCAFCMSCGLCTDCGLMEWKWKINKWSNYARRYGIWTQYFLEATNLAAIFFW